MDLGQPTTNSEISTTMTSTANESAQEQTPQTRTIHVDLDFFGLKKLWDKMPLEKLAAKHIVFIISLIVFLTYSIAVISLHTQLRDSLPTSIMLFLLTGAAAWQAFRK